MRIMIVDDNIDAAESLSDLLELEGHQVEIFLSGDSAVTAYDGDKFKMVMMDLKMPGMSGVEAIRQIKAIDKNASVIVISGNTVLEDLEEVSELGIKALFRKPYDVNELIHRVHQESLSG